MDAARAYLLSVTGAALLCAMANGFLGKKGSAGAARLLTGLFLGLTVLKPLGNWNPDFFEDISFSISDAAQEAVEQGEGLSKKELANIIKEKTSAYILEKAKQYNAELHVVVEVSDDTIPVPVRVRIMGQIGPYAKSQLQTIIQEQLGISKENQQWT